MWPSAHHARPHATRRRATASCTRDHGSSRRGVGDAERERQRRSGPRLRRLDCQRPGHKHTSARNHVHRQRCLVVGGGRVCRTHLCHPSDKRVRAGRLCHDDDPAVRGVASGRVLRLAGEVACARASEVTGVHKTGPCGQKESEPIMRGVGTAVANSNPKRERRAGEPLRRIPERDEVDVEIRRRIGDDPPVVAPLASCSSDAGPRQRGPVVGAYLAGIRSDDPNRPYRAADAWISRVHGRPKETVENVTVSDDALGVASLTREGEPEMGDS